MAVTPSTPYAKPFKSVDEQLDLLASRGLTLGDRTEAREHLRRVGYYRLSGYWYPLRESVKTPGQAPVVTDQFVAGATLANVIEIYQFDRKLRLLTLDAIEKIESSAP
ncbi:Abi family protein [Gordonia terrae]|nr:Abi family protein [Gordonia terrae]